jgi:hypothetical protein
MVMRTDQEILAEWFRTIFKSMDVIDAERFFMLINRNKFDYTEWQRNLWTDETVESLSQKAQKHWIEKYGQASQKA